MIRDILFLKKRILFSAFLLLFAIPVLTAQTVVSNGTTLKVSSGTVITELSPNGVTSAGVIDNAGTINLQGNLTNNGTAVLGTGTIVLNGTSQQTIGGTTATTFGSLTVNNAAGVVLANSARVEGTLSLTNGLVTLGANNLTMGASAAAVAGPPSATKMIVATGTGELRKEFSGTGSYTFPVGDNSDGADYSPATLNFTGGTFGSGAYAAVKVSPTPWIQAGADAYINRQWTLSQNAISSFLCNISLIYTDADVVAPEAPIYTVRVSDPVSTYDPTISATNTLIATGLNSFSTFSGMRGASSASIIAFLEGPNNGAGAMTTDLPQFTLGAPWFSTSPFPLIQPYSVAPWNYSGVESVATVPTGVVDWVYIELRQATAPALATASTIFMKKVAFVKSDGSIVDLDGVSPVKFIGGAPTAGNNVYVVLKHRLHLAVMSSAGLTKDVSGVYAYNFSDAGAKSYGYPDGIKLVGGKWSLVGSNGYFNDVIDSDDVSFVWDIQSGKFEGYYSGDFNMNGTVDSDDISFIWDINSGKFGNIYDNLINHGYRSMVP